MSLQTDLITTSEATPEMGVASATLDLASYDRWLHFMANQMRPWYDDLHDDIVQEGRIAMWQAAPKHDPNKGALASWVTVAARNRMRDFAWNDKPAFGHEPMRGSKPVEVITSVEAIIAQSPEFWDRLEMEGAFPDFAEHVILAYHHGELRQAIEALTEEQRRYIILRFWGGLEPMSAKPADRELRKTEVVFSHANRPKMREALEELEFKLSHLRDGFGDRT